METPSRPQRNRRHSRRAWPPEDDFQQPRPTKRLFTPEIKRMLKDWLIRRRENPYPNRDEKKQLAIETGLTYTQICNWFANWRRKLKNSERERAKKSWGHLIKHYNTNAKGNVEQFSISSEDSIWDEEEHEAMMRAINDDSCDEELNKMLHNAGNEAYYYATTSQSNNKLIQREVMRNNCTTAGAEHLVYNAQQYLQLSNTSTSHEAQHLKLSTSISDRISTSNRAKYKHKMMEKYLRDTCGGKHDLTHKLETPPVSTGAELSKWLESAAKFTPNKNNYHIEWKNKSNKLDGRQRIQQCSRIGGITTKSQDIAVYDTIHHKDELDAAEALANLAFNCRQRMFDNNSTIISS